MKGKKVIREVALKKFGEIVEVSDDVAPHGRGSGNAVLKKD